LRWNTKKHVGVAIDGEWVFVCVRVKRECVLRVREGSRNF